MSLTIAQVTPSLGIGGVETYLYRLAHGLTARGHRVIFVVQEPGVYADRATATGAQLISVPFVPVGVDQAAVELADANVDLVHAHNYRAARFGAGLARALGTCYLMSVHGPRPLWQRLFFTEWSSTVVAMSEGDRYNITGPLGVTPERIELSFYGIDAGRFGPHVDGSAFREELGLRDQPLIVHVSRFSHRKARPALALIEALPGVRRRLPGTTLALVGDGPELGKIEAKAKELNQRTKRAAIRVVGPRTDIPEVMAAADAVVATANTAIEAIAVGTGTIAFGRTGYFGIVNVENLPRAQAVCFGDHGRPAGREVTLAEDLIQALKGDAAEAARLAELVARDFNVARMAEHMEQIYLRALESAPKRSPAQQST